MFFAVHDKFVRRFQQERGAALPPLPMPAGALPALPRGVPGRVPMGDLPTLAELRAAVSAQALQGLPAEVRLMLLLCLSINLGSGELYQIYQMHLTWQSVYSQVFWTMSCMLQIASAAAQTAISANACDTAI